MVVTEAPSVHRATELVCTFFSNFMPKAFTPKELSRICTLPLRYSLCRRHLRNIAFTSVHSVTPCAHYISLLVITPYFVRTSYYPVTVSLITLYLVLNILLLCLLLPCTMSYITLLPCLTLLCYHIFHYPVSIKECKTTKKELTS